MSGTVKGEVTVPIAASDLGTGSPSGSNFLRGDSTWAVPSGTAVNSPFDTILSSQVVSGNADFFSVSGQTLTLIANATDPFEYNIAGTIYSLTANQTLLVTDNAHNFIYIDAAGALSRSATPPTFAYTAPAGPASGDYWYDLGKHLMKTWNGSTWVASAVIFIGYVRCDSGTIAALYACEPVGLTPPRRWAELGDGSDGFLVVTSGTTTIDGFKQYTAIVITGGTLNHTAAATLVLSVKCQGPVVILGTGAISLVGKGRAAVSGSATTPSASASTWWGGTGGSGGGGTNAGGNSGAHLDSTDGAGRGGKTGGGAGAAGSAGEAASVVYPSGWDGFVQGISGTAGGGGGGDNSLAGGNSGAAGGGMNLFASAIAVATTATFSASGADGTASAGNNRGGGGGGGGGILNLKSGSYFESAAIVAAGGAAGGNGGFTGAGAGGVGGAGLVLRKRI